MKKLKELSKSDRPREKLQAKGAEAMSDICGLPVRHMVHQQYVTGSLGIFVPERYGAPVITVELEGPELSPGLRKALLFAIGGS